MPNRLTASARTVPGGRSRSRGRWADLAVLLSAVCIAQPLGPAAAGWAEAPAEGVAAASAVVLLIQAGGEAQARGAADLWQDHGAEADFVVAVFDTLRSAGMRSADWAGTWLGGDEAQLRVGRLVAGSLLTFRRNARVSHAVIGYLGPEGLKEVVTAAAALQRSPTGTPATRVLQETAADLGVGLAALMACASRTSGTWASGAAGGRRLAEDPQLAASVFYFTSAALRRAADPGDRAAGTRRPPSLGGEFDPAFLLTAATTLTAMPFVDSTNPQGGSHRPDVAGPRPPNSVGLTLLRWTQGPLPEPAPFGVGHTRVDAFGWLLWAGATNSQVAQALLADEDFRIYVLTGAGAQAWRAESLRGLIHAAVLLPNAPEAQATASAREYGAYTGAASTAAALVRTAGREDLPMAPGARRAVGDVLAAYMPAVVPGSRGGRIVTASWFLGSPEFSLRWPGGAPAFEQGSLLVALAQVRTDPTAYASLAAAIGRYSRDRVLSTHDTPAFGEVTRIMLRRIDRILGVGRDWAESTTLTEAAQYLAYHVMSQPVGTDRSDPVATSQESVVHNDRWVIVMDRLAAAVPPRSSGGPRMYWGLTAARLYLQFGHSDPAVVAWFQAILPPPSLPVYAVEPSVRRDVHHALYVGPLDSSVAPLFDGHRDTVQVAEQLADDITRDAPAH